jgi:glutamate synthase (NADPH/NADH) large chain
VALQPGKMLLIDLEEGPHRLRRGDQGAARDRHPYKDWLARTQIVLEDLPPVEPRALRKDVSLLDRQQAFGYTQEDTKL